MNSYNNDNYYISMEEGNNNYISMEEANNNYIYMEEANNNYISFDKTFSIFYNIRNYFSKPISSSEEKLIDNNKIYKMV